MPRQKIFHGIQADSAVDAFASACANSMFAEMKLLLADGVDIDGLSDTGETPLERAASLLLSRVVSFLIESGADINKPGTNFDITPLMHACSRGGTKGSRIALQLLEAGADVRYVRRADEMTALKFAAHSCTPQAIQALIDRGAVVDGPRGTDQTALMLAAREGHIDGMRMLIQNGADVSRKCKLPWARGWTALELAKCEKRRKAVAYLQKLAKKQE